ncbi:MAG: ATP-binding protein [Candidatus Sericytochromatia bacterium]|nr:ATP-binding protein [Candidatus Sericytochromatia bacterium]
MSNNGERLPVQPALAIFVGLPGAGKSTFYENYLAKTHQLVSKDRLRNARHRDQRQLELVRLALAAGRDVVVDNTNPSLADREALIALGKALQATIVAYFFPPDIPASLARNSQRQGKACVPVVAIMAKAKILQPPTLLEGFDAVFTVQTLERGQFSIDTGLGVTDHALPQATRDTVAPVP